MNIQTMHTAAYSPWSNGLCERNHAVIDDSVSKIMAEQPDCSFTIALIWAVNAKNCLQIVGGYSPYQLVFGRNPSFPSVHSDLPPAQNEQWANQYVHENLMALHSARKHFIQQESSERLRRGLARKN